MNQKPADALARQQGFTATGTSVYVSLVELDEDTDPRCAALASHLDCTLESVSECRYGDNQYESTDEPGEYLVVTDSEADELWDAALESYIDECILPETSGPLAQYFDREAWKRDARHDGRGHALSPYDGDEHDVKVDGETYYIYRGS